MFLSVEQGFHASPQQTGLAVSLTHVHPLNCHELVGFGASEPIQLFNKGTQLLKDLNHKHSTRLQ